MANEDRKIKESRCMSGGVLRKKGGRDEGKEENKKKIYTIKQMKNNIQKQMRKN